MAGKGLDVVDAVCVHILTLTRPGAMSKDIGAWAFRVLADD
jgi:hypothetical protein